MSRRIAVTVSLWAAVLAVMLALTFHYGRFGGSIGAFLPRSGDVVQQTLMHGLQEGQAARLVLMAIGGGSSGERRHLARALARRLRQASALFSLAAAGPGQQDPMVTRFLQDHRYLLAPRRSWTTRALRVDLSRLVTVLESPAGLGAGALLRDPTGAFFAAARPWTRTTGPATHRGVWVAGRQALVVAVTRHSGFAIRDARAAMVRIKAAWAALPHHACRLQVAGTAAITVATNRHVATQARWLAVTDAVLIMLLLGFVYRSAAAVGASLVPMVTGGVVATAVVAALFPVVSLITLGFGTMLIGVAMDYPAYVLLHVTADGAVERSARRVQSTLLLAVTAMVLGFATLLLSRLDGLVQLAVFAASGLAAAAWAARVLVPVMVPAWPPRSGLRTWDRRITGVMAFLRRGRWLVVPICIAAAVLVWRTPRVWDDGISALSPVNPALMATTRRLSRDFGAPSMTYEVVVEAPSAEAALARSARLLPLLARLRRRGDIEHFDMAARYLPSLATQRLRQRALPDPVVLRQRLARALAGLPIRPQALAPFVAAVALARHAPLVTIDAMPSPLRARIEALLATARGRHLALIPLGGVKAPAAVRDAVDAAPVRGVHFVDSRQTIRALLRTYRLALMHDALIAALLMTTVIAVGLRSLPAAMRVVIPMAGALLADCGLLVACGVRLTLLNVVAFLLIAGLGMGYALFLGGDRGGARPLAPWLCAATTITGFGVMAASTVAMLATVGTTVSAGALLALLFTAAWSQPGRLHDGA